MWPAPRSSQKQMEGMGFTFYLGAKTQEFVQEQKGLTVVLEGGERLPADMVLISAGVRPELTLAKSLNLEIDKGVQVDDAMRTSRPDIYAAGDLVEHRGRFYGIWPACLEQGEVAGANMAGQNAIYEGTVPANDLKVVGIDLMAAGDIDADGQFESQVIKDEEKKIYRKLVIKDNIVIGAILLGDLRRSREIQQAIKMKQEISSLQRDLHNIL